MSDEGSTRLLVARHGETEHNAGERWQGWTDSPLTPRGIAQARALGRRLAAESLAAVYSSDTGRAIHTAQLALEAHALPLQQHAGLRERDTGLFSGLTGAEVAARFPQEMAARRGMDEMDWAPPDGESFRMMLARLTPTIAEIARAWPGQSVLIVTHGGVIRLLAAQARGNAWGQIYDDHPGNCGLSTFIWHPEHGLTLEHFSEQEHLLSLE